MNIGEKSLDSEVKRKDQTCWAREDFSLSNTFQFVVFSFALPLSAPGCPRMNLRALCLISECLSVY